MRWVIVRAAVVWECGGRVWCVKVRQETAGIVTRAPEQHEQVTKGHTPRSGRGQGTEDRATKIRGHRGRKGPGAMQEGSRLTQPPPKTTTTMQHPITGGARGGGGSNEELKEKQNKVKINSSEHYESDYRRAE